MSTASHIQASPNVCRILSLDGGGAKGFYILGVLKQVEAMLGGQSLCEHFDLIFGTSTGAIMAALVTSGHQIDSVLKAWRIAEGSQFELMGLSIFRPHCRVGSRKTASFS
jgi:patatin-like phospholipase/acyl hydrolase